MPTPTSQMNGGSRSKLPVFHSSLTSSSSPSNLKRTNDELRQHISRLKAELEIEKAKSKQIHRDKVADIKRLKDEFDKEKIVAHGSTLDKLKNEHEVEIKKLKDSLQKEKEIEIKQILKFKDEELRTTKKILQEDKDFSLREQEEKLKRGFVTNKTNNDIEIKLRQELNECRKQKQQFEDLYKQKSAAELEKSELIRQLKDEHEKENQRVLRDARIQIARNVHELKNAQRALAEKEQEMTKRELELTRLEEQKEYLSDKIRADVKRNSEHAENGLNRTEKEKELQLKNLELRKTLDDITRKNHILEKEASLKRADSKDSETSSRAEVRVKELKKRNGELVNLAKKLEEKAKRLQEELRDLKSRDSSSRPNGDEATSSPRAFENFKKSFTMQRAKDLAENAKATMAKDKEIVQLKEKIAMLEERLKSNDEDASEVQKLHIIIHQIEKEKLKLEKQFAADIAEAKNSLRVDHSQEDALRNDLEDLQREKEQLQRSNAVQAGEIKELQEKIEILRKKEEQFDSLVLQLKERNQEYEQLVEDLDLRENECKELKESIETAEKEIKKHETEREKDHIMLKNLHNKMADMSQRLVEMENVENECRNLQQRLSDAEKQCNLMTDQLESLQDKISDFKKLEQDLKESEEKCKKWERDYDFAVEQINKRNKEIGDLQETQLQLEKSHDQEVGDLREEISRLEEICVELEGKENEYKQLLEAQIPKASQFNHVYVQTSRQNTPLSSQQDVVTEDIVPDIETVAEADIDLEGFEGTRLQDDEKTDDLSLLESEPDISSKCEDDILDIASSRIAALAAMSSSEGELSREDPLDLDKYIHKSEEIVEDRPTNNQDKVHENQEKLEKDKFHFDDGDTSDELSLSLDEMESDDDDDVQLPPSNNNRIRAKAQQGLESKPKEHQENPPTNRTHPAAMKRLSFKDKQDSDSSIFGPITPQESVDEISRDTIKQSSIDESVADSIPCRVDKLSVFIAKYTYDPFEHSPNDDPSLELSLEAGDYVYIFGEVDEDGFYTGELVNGQRGLVPSNFVEKIADENELIPISTGHDGYPGDESDEDLTEVSASVSPASSLNIPEEDKPLDAEYLKSTPRPSSSQNITDVFNGQSESEDDNIKEKGLPPPRKLKMERQLNNSIVISWLPPADVPEGEVLGYSIKANGEVKETVIGANRTRAIVSDINHDKVYRISVHCFDKHEKESPGSVATITIGRGASAVPSDLKIQNLSPTSADLEWACGNSSMLHAIYLDGREVHVVKPGIDEFKLTDLVPDHEYEVHVEARQSKDVHKKSNIRPATSRSLLFTTPKGGPPDPPLNVQAQVRRKSASHRQTSILISWLPVTITDIGTSNGAMVQGYKIYMNDNEAAVVDLPTSDHVDILASDLHEVLSDSKVDVIELWVKTQSSLGESVISNVVVLKMDQHLLNEIYRGERRGKDSDKQLDLERKLSTGDLKLFKKVQPLEKKPSLERKFSDGKATVDGELPKREVNEAAYASVSVLEVEGAQTDMTGAGTFDLNRNDSDLDRKLDWINQLTATEEEKGREVTSKKKKESESEVLKSEARKEAGKAGMTKKATVIRYDVVDSDDSESSDEGDSDDEVPHVYDILREEDGKSGGQEAAKMESSTQDKDSRSSENGPPENLILPTIPLPDYSDKSEDSEKGPDIPLPDYPDAIEVKPRTNFPLDQLLSDSDSNSELSAIEEETVEELLAYNKDGSRCVSPGKISKSTSLDRAQSGLSPDTADKTYSMHSDNGNKTYSLHSNEEKNRTFDLEEKDGKMSDKKSSRTSKDTLTFSSDDVMDLLDKDMIGAVPELPLDEEKNRKEVGDHSKKEGKIESEGSEKRSGTRARDEKPSVETSKKPQMSEDSRKVASKMLESTKKKKVPEKSSERESKTLKQDRSSGKAGTESAEIGGLPADKGELSRDTVPLSPKALALSAETRVQNVIECDKRPPAKQSPVATKDQPNVDAKLERRKWAHKPENVSKIKIDFAVGKEDIIAHAEQLGEPVRLEDGYVENTDSPHGLLDAKDNTAYGSIDADIAKSGADSKQELPNLGEDLLPEAQKDLKQTLELQHNETPAVTDNGSVFASNLAPESQMGQANVSAYNDSDIDVELQELDDESSIKIPLTSVHDLYTLNAVDSFDDSALESESDYKPYFTPVGAHENAEKEAFEAQQTTEFGMGSVENRNRTTESNFNDNATGFLSTGPVIDNESFTETPIYKDINSGEPVARSQGDNKKDNIMNGNNEISNTDTRSNHVDSDTQSNNVRVFVALFSYDPITMSPNTEGVDEELTFNEGDLIKIFGDCDEDGFYFGELHDKRGLVPSNMVQEVSLGDFGNSLNIPPPPEDLSGDTEENISQENLGHESGSTRQTIASERITNDSQPQGKEASRSKGPRNEPGRSTDRTSEEELQSQQVSERRKSKKEPSWGADKNNEDNVQERKNNNPKMEEIATELENIDLDEQSRDYRYISERDSIYCLPPRRMIALYDYDPAVSSPNVDSEVELAFNKGDIIVVFGDMDEDGFFAAQTETERGLVPSNFLEECPEPSDSEEIEINMGAASPSIKSLSRKSSGASITGASPVDSPKSKKKKGFLAKSKKIFSKLKGK